MKTPDEIKKTLECCFRDSAQRGECPYYPVSCDMELVRDAREYILRLELDLAYKDAANVYLREKNKHLEAERDALIKYITDSSWAACDICKHGIDGARAMNCKHIREVGVPCFEWRGVQKEESEDGKE